MTEPQPIDTAPKDERILVYNAVTGWYSSEYSQEAKTWVLYFWSKKGEWYPHPTHWMPLPERPE